MKYHKIHGVEKTVCTAEQKIAYNLAQAHHDYIKRLVVGGSVKSWPEASRELLNMFTAAYDYKPGKYDLDAIFCALNAGLEAFVKKPFIATSYNQIGEAFPALYLNA